MKILYLCADPGIPLYGRKGCSTHVRETCTALARTGHQVKIVCSNTEGDHNGLDHEVITVPVPTSRKLGFDLRHVLLDWRLAGSLDRLIRQWRPDAIYERYSLYARSGARLARRFGLPRLLEVNAFLTREQVDRIKLIWLARRIERAIIRRRR